MHAGLSSCGLDDAERIATYQVIAALLYLGETGLEANDDDGSKIATSGAANVKQACELTLTLTLTLTLSLSLTLPLTLTLTLTLPRRASC